MASCTATTGAADQCDLLRKTLGRRSASKAEQVCVAASCSSPPEPFAGSPPSPALHRQVHVLRRSCRTFSPRALVCVGYFSVPPSSGSNGPSTWQQPAAQCSELVAAGSSPPPRQRGCGACRCTRTRKVTDDRGAGGSRHALEGGRPALVLASCRTARTRARALHACVPLRLRRGESMWPSSTPSSRSSWSEEASRAPRAAPAVARARRRSASGRAAPRAVRREAAGRSGLRLRRCALRRPAAVPRVDEPLPPAPRARRRASRPSGGAPWRVGGAGGARRLAHGRGARFFLHSSVFSFGFAGTVGSHCVGRRVMSVCL